MDEEIARLREFKSRRSGVTEEYLVFPHPKDPKRAMIDDLAFAVLYAARSRRGRIACDLAATAPSGCVHA
jgi:hypothetical protein